MKFPFKVFLDWKLKFVLDLSLFILLIDRLVEVLDFFDFDDFWLPLGDEVLRFF